MRARASSSSNSAARALPAEYRGLASEEVVLQRHRAEGLPEIALTVTTDQAADRLLSASSSAAARAELHAHLNEGGVMRMKALDVIVLAPGERVSLRPSGLHVMLVDLKAPLREGTRLTLTLGFAKAGEVTLEVPVLRNPPAEAGPGH